MTGIQVRTWTPRAGRMDCGPLADTGRDTILVEHRSTTIAQ